MGVYVTPPTRKMTTTSGHGFELMTRLVDDHHHITFGCDAICGGSEGGIEGEEDSVRFGMNEPQHGHDVTQRKIKIVLLGM